MVDEKVFGDKRFVVPACEVMLGARRCRCVRPRADVVRGCEWMEA